MSAQLCKLHVRFIQTQKSFFLFNDSDTNGERLPLSQLYVKDNSSFYLINQETPIKDENIKIRFKEPTDILKSLQCDVQVKEIEKRSEEFEDALLFFNVDACDVKQVLLLSINAIEDN